MNAGIVATSVGTKAYLFKIIVPGEKYTYVCTCYTYASIDFNKIILL